MTEVAAKTLCEEIAELLSDAVETLWKARSLAVSSDLYATRRFGWDIQDLIINAQSLLDNVRDSGGGDR